MMDAPYNRENSAVRLFKWSQWRDVVWAALGRERGTKRVCFSSKQQLQQQQQQQEQQQRHKQTPQLREQQQQYYRIPMKKPVSQPESEPGYNTKLTATGDENSPRHLPKSLSTDAAVSGGDSSKLESVARETHCLHSAPAAGAKAIAAAGSLRVDAKKAVVQTVDTVPSGGVAPPSPSHTDSGVTPEVFLAHHHHDHHHHQAVAGKDIQSGGTRDCYEVPPVATPVPASGRKRVTVAAEVDACHEKSPTASILAQQHLDLVIGSMDTVPDIWHPSSRSPIDLFTATSPLSSIDEGDIEGDRGLESRPQLQDEQHMFAAAHHHSSTSGNIPVPMGRFKPDHTPLVSDIPLLVPSSAGLLDDVEDEEDTIHEELKTAAAAAAAAAAATSSQLHLLPPQSIAWKAFSPYPPPISITAATNLGAGAGVGTGVGAAVQTPTTAAMATPLTQHKPDDDTVAPPSATDVRVEERSIDAPPPTPVHQFNSYRSFSPIDEIPLRRAATLWQDGWQVYEGSPQSASAASSQAGSERGSDECEMASDAPSYSSSDSIAYSSFYSYTSFPTGHHPPPPPTPASTTSSCCVSTGPSESILNVSETGIEDNLPTLPTSPTSDLALGTVTLNEAVGGTSSCCNIQDALLERVAEVAASQQSSSMDDTVQPLSTLSPTPRRSSSSCTISSPVYSSSLFPSSRVPFTPSVSSAFTPWTDSSSAAHSPLQMSHSMAVEHLLPASESASGTYGHNHNNHNNLNYKNIATLTTAHMMVDPAGAVEGNPGFVMDSILDATEQREHTDIKNIGTPVVFGPDASSFSDLSHTSAAVTNATKNGPFEQSCHTRLLADEYSASVSTAYNKRGPEATAVLCSELQVRAIGETLHTFDDDATNATIAANARLVAEGTAGGRSAEAVATSVSCSRVAVDANVGKLSGNVFESGPIFHTAATTTATAEAPVNMGAQNQTTTVRQQDTVHQLQLLPDLPAMLPSRSSPQISSFPSLSAPSDLYDQTSAGAEGTEFYTAASVVSFPSPVTPHRSAHLRGETVPHLPTTDRPDSVAVAVVAAPAAGATGGGEKGSDQYYRPVIEEEEEEQEEQEEDGREVKAHKRSDRGEQLWEERVIVSEIEGEDEGEKEG